MLPSAPEVCACAGVRFLFWSPVQVTRKSLSLGVEWYYTGVQQLEENPYGDRSKPYFVGGVPAERQWGRFRLFVNGENLNDVRQTRWHPLVRPARAGDGRWTVDAWAPLEGRTMNGGVRMYF